MLGCVAKSRRDLVMPKSMLECVAKSRRDLDVLKLMFGMCGKVTAWPGHAKVNFQLAWPSNGWSALILAALFVGENNFLGRNVTPSSGQNYN